MMSPPEYLHELKDFVRNFHYVWPANYLRFDIVVGDKSKTICSVAPTSPADEKNILDLGKYTLHKLVHEASKDANRVGRNASVE